MFFVAIRKPYFTFQNACLAKKGTPVFQLGTEDKDDL